MYNEAVEEQQLPTSNYLPYFKVEKKVEGLLARAPCLVMDGLEGLALGFGLLCGLLLLQVREEWWESAPFVSLLRSPSLFLA